MERCPNCGARCDGSDQCRRCGLGLAPLLAVEAAAEALICNALTRLAAGDAEGALFALSRGRSLRRDPFIDCLRGFARAEAAGQKLFTCVPGHDRVSGNLTAPEGRSGRVPSADAPSGIEGRVPRV